MLSARALDRGQEMRVASSAQNVRGFPTSEEMKERAVSNLNMALKIRNRTHAAQLRFFDVLAQKLYAEFLEGASSKLIMKRVETELVSLARQATINTVIPNKLVLSKRDTHRIPVYLCERINGARENLAQIQEDNMESLRMILGETLAQIKDGEITLQAYSSSVAILTKTRGNMASVNLKDLYGSRPEFSDFAGIIGRALNDQKCSVEKLQEQVYSMKALVRLSEGRRLLYNSFDGDASGGNGENRGKAPSLHTNLSSDMLASLAPEEKAPREKAISKPGARQNRKKKKRASVIQQALLYTAPNTLRRQSKAGAWAKSPQQLQKLTFGEKASLHKQEISNLKLKIEYTKQLLKEVSEQEQKETEEKKKLMQALTTWNGSSGNVPAHIRKIIADSAPLLPPAIEKSSNKPTPDGAKATKAKAAKAKKTNSPGYVDFRKRSKSSQVSSSIIAVKRNISLRKVAVLKVQSFVRGCLARKYYGLLKARRDEVDESDKYKRVQQRAVKKIVRKLRQNLKKKQLAKRQKLKRLSMVAASVALKRQTRKAKKKNNLQVIAAQAAITARKNNVSSYIDYIWHKYDADSSESLEIEEVQSMINDYVSMELPYDMCAALVQSIRPHTDDEEESDSEEELTIDKASFSGFVSHGITMSEKELEDYKSRSHSHHILSDWFKAIQYESEKFSKHSKINANSLFRKTIQDEAAAIARERQDIRRRKKQMTENITKAATQRNNIKVAHDNFLQAHKSIIQRAAMKGKRLSQKYAEGYNSHLLELDLLKNTTQSEAPTEDSNQDVEKQIEPKPVSFSDKVSINTDAYAAEDSNFAEHDGPLSASNSHFPEDDGEESPTAEHSTDQIDPTLNSFDEEGGPPPVKLGDPKTDDAAKKAKRLEKMKRRLEKKKAKAKKKEMEQVPEENVKQEIEYTKSERAQYMSYIWNKYDEDNSDYLDGTELKRMIDNYSNQDVSMELVDEFLEQIDEDGDQRIQRNELVHFVDYGLRMSEKDREEYASRGVLQAAMIDFFSGFEKEKEEFKRGNIIH